MKAKILYVEDEPFLSKVVKEMLENKGYEVLHEPNGAIVMTHFKNFKPDICLLDIMLPNVDGYTLGKNIRLQHPTLPIIFLTAKTQSNDVVKGFESGGTDYIRKPFSMEELEVRIINQLSISGNKSIQREISMEEFKLGACIFDAARMELKIGPTIHKLSHKEALIMQHFARNQNNVIDRKELLLAVWGDDSFFNSRTLDVYIKKFRDYFAHTSGIEIITLKGKGYQFLVS